MTDKAILDSLSSVEYGFYDYKHKKPLIEDELEKADSKYIHYNCRVLKPDELLKYKVGTCWDTSLYIYSKLKEAGYRKVRLIYLEIWDKQFTTHACTVYQHINSKLWYWMEYSWEKYRGIHGGIFRFDFLIKRIRDYFCNEYHVSKPEYINISVDVDKLLACPILDPASYLSIVGSTIFKQGS